MKKRRTGSSLDVIEVAPQRQVMTSTHNLWALNIILSLEPFILITRHPAAFAWNFLNAPHKYFMFLWLRKPRETSLRRILRGKKTTPANPSARRSSIRSQPETLEWGNASRWARPKRSRVWTLINFWNSRTIRLNKWATESVLLWEQTAL